MRLAVVLGSGLLTLGMCGVAASQPPPPPPAIGQVTFFHARFTAHRAGTATGLRLHTKGQPPAPDTSEAPAVQQTIVLPAGSSLRLGKLPQCTASDAMIAAQGAEGACPASSRVGTGGADGLLNGAPTHFDVGIYAVRGHLLFAAEQNGKPLKQAFPGVAHGRRLILRVPTLEGRIAPTGFTAQIPARPSGHVWLRTPTKCPASGRWRFVGGFQGYSDTGSAGTPITPAQVRRDHERCRQG